MSLWKATDAADSAPTYLNADDKADTYFVDTDEAAVAENRAKGIRTPGWNLIREYGNGRISVEPLAVVRRTADEAGNREGDVVEAPEVIDPENP
jgi:hypothetical protein